MVSIEEQTRLKKRNMAKVLFRSCPSARANSAPNTTIKLGGKVTLVHVNERRHCAQEQQALATLFQL